MIDLIIESPYYKEIVGKGRKEESERIVLKQLTRRFGELSEEIKLRLKVLSVEQTENFAEAIFDFNNLDDVKIWLSNVELGLKE